MLTVLCAQTTFISSNTQASSCLTFSISLKKNDRNLGSISSTFYKQLLRMQIPKVQKKTDDLTVVLGLLGSARIKAGRQHVDEIDP